MGKFLILIVQSIYDHYATITYVITGINCQSTKQIYEWYKAYNLIFAQAKY
jgi:hypothetical protein